MPEGPLGGPRPASKAPLSVVLRFDSAIKGKDVPELEAALQSASEEIAGSTLARSDLGGEGTTAEIETDREQVFIEEIKRMEDRFNSLSPIEIAAISINSD